MSHTILTIAAITIFTAPLAASSIVVNGNERSSPFVTSTPVPIPITAATISYNHVVPSSQPSHPVLKTTSRRLGHAGNYYYPPNHNSPSYDYNSHHNDNIDSYYNTYNGLISRDGGGGHGGGGAGSYSDNSMSLGGYGGYGGGYGMDSEDSKGGSGSGLAGLVGLLGLKGLKGLLPTILPIILPLILLLALPIILQAVLPLLLLLIVAAVGILFIPIPVITTPGGRNLDQVEIDLLNRANNGTLTRSPLILETITDDECIERITCEIALRVQKNYGINSTDDIIKRFISKKQVLSSPKWIQRILKGLKLDSKDCKKSLCFT